MLQAATSTLAVTSTPALGSPRLLASADPHRTLAWLRRGDGMVGVGEAARLSFSGPDRFLAAKAAWQELVSRAEIQDEVRVPGSGLMAFGAFAFADGSASTSTLIVPRIVLGRRNGVSWITRIAPDGEDAPTAPAPRPAGHEYRLTFEPGELPPETYLQAVQDAVSRIQAGPLGKVVLARDIRAHLPRFADLRLALGQLAGAYADTWTFAVDGLVGSSPETLVQVRQGVVGARVLAGSARRGEDADDDARHARDLVSSGKDREEHEYAVASVLSALRPHAPRLSSSDEPFPLKLPNLWHLASDVKGRLADGSTSLDLLAALHPTAAVAGSPTSAALELIEELEPFDRGRYAGPVGWVDASGDGEWAVALRCAQLEADGTLTAYAGAGIVAESEPERELAETTLKFQPIVDAFG
ncbi:MAG: isochorismate synthase [Naasia sp.]|nr:isochorismate synthase [Naasia sp.]